jgi:hypothetical protein
MTNSFQGTSEKECDSKNMNKHTALVTRLADSLNDKMDRAKVGKDLFNAIVGEIEQLTQQFNDLSLRVLSTGSSAIISYKGEQVFSVSNPDGYQYVFMHCRPRGCDLYENRTDCELVENVDEATNVIFDILDRMIQPG